MMNKQALLGMWDMMRQRHGITLRLLEAMPADKFHSRPVADMRTPAELITHVYGVSIRDIPAGVLKGSVATEESKEKEIAAGLKSGREVIAYAEDCWKKGTASVEAITDQQLGAVVSTEWGFSVPGWMMMGITSDEYLHHRGQLYVFARSLGTAPPLIWDFANNAPAYRPKEGAHS